MKRATTFALVIVALAAASVSAAEPAHAAVARNLYVNKCARCHKLYDPAAYDEAQWKQWLLKMQRKVRLTDEQWKQLIDYRELLQGSSRKKVNP